MSEVQIFFVNREIDEQTAALVDQVFALVPEHWQVLLPDVITVHVEDRPFNYVPELKQFCALVERDSIDLDDDQWRLQTVIGTELKPNRAELWVRDDCRQTPRDRHYDYYQRKKLLCAIARVLWAASSLLRAATMNQDWRLGGAGRGLQYLAYRDAFTLFIQNPQMLKEGDGDTWRAFEEVDALIRRNFDAQIVRR